MARPTQPRVCRQCGIPEGEVQLSARKLCRDCANQRIQDNMRLMREAIFGRQSFAYAPTQKPEPALEVLREAAAIVDAADAVAAQEEKLTHHAAVALAELGKDVIEELKATGEPIKLERRNGCIWITSGDKERYLHI